MPTIANMLVTTSLVAAMAFATMEARAADIDATSAVDAVTVYPDGASITRVMTLDMPAGDNTLVAKDFPLTLDPSSLRVEGEAGAKLTIGAIDTRPPRAAPPVHLPELDKRIEALKDERANLAGAINAAAARRKFAERFADTSPAGLGEKSEARPIAEWRAAFAAVAEEVASADAAIRDAERKQRDIDREIARLESDRATKPPRKLEVRIDVATAAATRATLRVTYAVRNARWAPIYDARLDTGAKDRRPALELVRRAEITQTTGEDWSNVALAVSTVRTARGGSAPELGSLIVQYPQVPRPLAAGSVSSDMARPRAMPAPQAAEARAKIADEQQATAEVGGFQVTFRIPGRVSLGANEGAKSLRVSTATAPSCGAFGAGQGSDGVSRSKLQARRGRAAAAGARGDLSRRRVCRPRPNGRRKQGRNGAAWLRRRRQNQDRTYRRQAQRGLGRPDRDDVEDRRTQLQDQRAQRTRLPDPDRGRGSVAGERKRGNPGRDAAIDDPSDRDQCAREARRARMGVRGQTRRGEGHRVRVARALAQGQGGRDDPVRLRRYANAVMPRFKRGMTCRESLSAIGICNGATEAASHFAFRNSPTSSSTNSLSSALLGSRLDENGRLLSLPTTMWVASTRSTFSMVKNGNVSAPSLSGFFAFLSGSRIFIRSI
jgi:hypothetical protein